MEMAPSRLESGMAEEVIINNGTQLSGATAGEASRLVDSILTSSKKG